MRGLLLSCLLVLGACTPGAHPISASFEAAFGIGRVGTSPDAFAALRASGAPVMLAGIEKEGRAVAMLRSASRGGIETWRSIDNVTLSLRDGIVIASRGLGDDLLIGDPGAAGAVVAAAGSARNIRIHRYLDGTDGVMIVSYVCDMAPRGARKITMNKQQVDTVLVEEKCFAPSGGFTNLYWTRAGQVVQSRQYLSAGMGALALRLSMP